MEKFHKINFDVQKFTQLEVSIVGKCAGFLGCAKWVAAGFDGKAVNSIQKMIKIGGTFAA